MERSHRVGTGVVRDGDDANLGGEFFVAEGPMSPRLFKERTILFTLYGFTGCGCLVLTIILATVFIKGAPAINGAFLFEESRNFGLEGGIFYQSRNWNAVKA